MMKALLLALVLVASVGAQGIWGPMGRPPILDLISETLSGYLAADSVDTGSLTADLAVVDSIAVSDIAVAGDAAVVDSLLLGAGLGAELVTNGAFTDSSGWTYTAGWDWNAGVARHTPSGGVTTLSQTLGTLASGAVYEIRYTVVLSAGTSVTCSMGGVTMAARTASGTYVDQIITTATTGIAFTPTTNFDGSVDVVSVKLRSGAPLVFGRTNSSLSTSCSLAGDTLTWKQNPNLTNGDRDMVMRVVLDNGTAEELLRYDNGLQQVAIEGVCFTPAGSRIGSTSSLWQLGLSTGALAGVIYNDLYTFTDLIIGSATGKKIVLSNPAGTADAVYALGAIYSGLCDLIYGGAFGAATGWTVGAGWSVAGGKCTHASGTAALSQAATYMPLVAGQVYEVVFDVLDYPSGSGTLGISCGGTTVLAPTALTTARYRYTFTATNGTGALIFTPSTDWTGSLDNVYLWRQAAPVVMGGGWWTRSNTVTSTYQVLTAGNCVTLNAGSDQVVTLPAIAGCMNVYQQAGQRFRFYNYGAGHMVLTAHGDDLAANVLNGGDTLHVDQYAGVEVQAIPDLGVFAVLR